jgi:predicted RNA-binding protein with PUA-like domain
MNYWLVKSEPGAYSWTQLVRDGKTAWTGVRNYQARINLRAMKRGDPVCFYHSGGEKLVVGLARVAKEAYPDPTATEGDWACVDLEPVKPLRSPVPLHIIRADPALQAMKLVRQSRLSVTPLTEAEFMRVLALGGIKE